MKNSQSTDIKIIYANTKLIPSFYKNLKAVAAERVYIEMITPPPLKRVQKFQKRLIRKNGPVYYALHKNNVVGWCDVFPEENPRQAHRGSLGMGILSEYRGKGIGSKLLAAVIQYSKAFGLEKIELHVYTTNKAAIKLYKKFGFKKEGLIKRYRKLDGVYFDCLAMGKFL